MADMACGECGSPLDEPSEGPATRRVSCPHCGSTTRKFVQVVDGSISFHEQVRLVKRDQEPGRPAEELTQGDDLNRDSGKWYDLTRHIDRRNNRYKERIVDPETGDVIREVDEPLSDHRGRGNAKRKDDGR